MDLNLIKKCVCGDTTPAAKWQSETYGPGMRVYTSSGKTGETLKCTVCGNGGNSKKK